MLSEPRDRLAEDRERFRDERLERELADEKRIRDRRKSHALTGGITLLLCLFLVDLLTLDFANMLNPVALFIKLVASAIFGAPAGYAISWMGGGMWRGAFIGAGIFFLIGVILGLPSLGERSFGGILGSGVFLGILGLFPGAIIGMHVEADS